MTLLKAILSLKRPAGSDTEREMINKFIKPTGAIEDSMGNLLLIVGSDPIIFSSHTDTMSKKAGYQEVKFDGKEMSLVRQYKKRTKNAKYEYAISGECLGADDGGGVWLMLKLIEAGISGAYIFHREEECGGKGSAYASKAYKDVLKDYKYCIAFDRRAADNLITHQGGTRTCSDAFGHSLIEQLDTFPFALNEKYKLDTTGSFTDSKNYIDIIPECTNLSIGYLKNHTSLETLDAEHLYRLKEAFLVLNVSKLVCERIAGTTESKYTAGFHSNLDNNYMLNWKWDFDLKRSRYVGKDKKLIKEEKANRKREKREKRAAQVVVKNKALIDKGICGPPHSGRKIHHEGVWYSVREWDKKEKERKRNGGKGIGEYVAFDHTPKPFPGTAPFHEYKGEPSQVIDIIKTPEQIQAALCPILAQLNAGGKVKLPFTNGERSSAAGATSEQPSQALVKVPITPVNDDEIIIDMVEQETQRVKQERASSSTEDKLWETVSPANTDLFEHYHIEDEKELRDLADMAELVISKPEEVTYLIKAWGYNYKGLVKDLASANRDIDNSGSDYH